MTTETRPFAGQLAGRTVVVTGGGRDIGKMITTGLLTAGARVYICSRKREDLDATVAELSGLGTVSAFVADLGAEAGVAALAAHVSEREDKIHTLFNNAGANWGATVEDFPASAWDRVLNVNLKGVFGLTPGAAAPAQERQLRRGPGTCGERRQHRRTACSLARLRQLLLLRQHGGRAPAHPAARRNTRARGAGQRHRARPVRVEDDRRDLALGEESLASQIPLKRIGRPADIAGLAVFLAGPHSTFITGAVIPIDGGMTASR